MNAREKFAKEILDMLDQVINGSPMLADIIYPLKQAIRELRDKERGK